MYKSQGSGLPCTPHPRLDGGAGLGTWGLGVGTGSGEAERLATDPPPTHPTPQAVGEAWSSFISD